MAKIFALVLTFNRRELLPRCLNAIVSQTHRCDEIIVIDNASSDGTTDMLQRDWAGRVRAYALSHNIGASGGYNAGIRIAYRQGADFIWAMDDDVIPAADALKTLIEGERFLVERNVEHSFVLSTAWTESGDVISVPKIDTRPASRGYETWPLYLQYRMVPVTRATFVSILLPRSTVARFGLPLAPMFIWGEDSEYTLRITKKHPGFLIADSKVLHLRAVNGALDILTETDQIRIGYYRHFVRNLLYTVRIYSPKLDFVRLVVHQVRLILQLIKDRQIRKARIVLRGLVESLWFRPKVETADDPIESLGVSVRSLSHSTPAACSVD